MKIQVTRNDIRKGIPDHPAFCPIARAIKRRTHKPVAVTGDYIAIFYRKQVATGYNTSIKVEAFIHDFDIGEKVKPFTFELEYLK